MKRLIHHRLHSIVLLVTVISAPSRESMAQQAMRRLPPPQVAVDEDILVALSDETCRNFEAARDAFVVGNNGQAAERLRVAAAFLRLEAARAKADGKVLLDASIRELHGLAAAVEDNQVRAVQILHQAFARAHYALAGHHCINCNHRCCQPSAKEDKKGRQLVGRDLKAATKHLERGAMWAGSEPDRETIESLNAAQLFADKLMQGGTAQQGQISYAIGSVRDTLQDFTGRKIMLAPPLAVDDNIGPSLFR